MVRRRAHERGHDTEGEGGRWEMHACVRVRVQATSAVESEQEKYAQEVAS